MLYLPDGHVQMMSSFIVKWKTLLTSELPTRGVAMESAGNSVLPLWLIETPRAAILRYPKENPKFELLVKFHAFDAVADQLTEPEEALVHK